MIALCIVLAVVYAALLVSKTRFYNLEGWQVVKVIKKQEEKAVLDERAACAAIAEMIERDKTMSDSMRSVAARIRVLIQARGVK